MSDFAARHTTSLLASALPASGSQSSRSESKQTLQALLVSLNPPIAPGSTAVHDALHTLRTLEEQRPTPFSTKTDDDEESALESAVLARITVALYAETLNTQLTQAAEAETEAEWWSDILRSQLDVLSYLLPSIPFRLHNVFLEIVGKLRSLNIPLSPSAFTPSSLRQLFPSPGSFRAGALLSAAYPHLREHPHAISLAVPRPELATLSLRNPQLLSSLRPQASYARASVEHVLLLPLELARQECATKRKALQQIRDARATALGRVLRLQSEMESLVNVATSARRDPADLQRDFAVVLQKLAQAIFDGDDGGASSYDPSQPTFFLLDRLATQTLPRSHATHAAHMRTGALRRPSRLARQWPRLVLLPPVLLFAVRYAYQSRASLAELASATLDTVDRFWHDWLLEPLRGVVQTVRAGSGERVIVSAKGLDADVESLERMSLALAKEKLNYTAAQLQELSSLIREGDLTPVLRIYEEDIKSPVKSAVSGTLLRSLFIQVQKAKVDIDQALAGIDKLLKSQELTFAFVGVAPAFALVYTLGGVLRHFLVGGTQRGRYGGVRRRTGAWLAIRRIERLLLISQPESSTSATGDIAPLTAGLLLLSVSHLREYATGFLPLGSRVREGVLEDVGDLEDPALGREAKLRIVERMWRNWGNKLGWTGLGEK